MGERTILIKSYHILFPSSQHLSNKKVFQSNSNCLLSKSSGHMMNNFEHVLGGSFIVRSKLDKFQHVWKSPFIVRSKLNRLESCMVKAVGMARAKGTLYSEGKGWWYPHHLWLIHCIMADGHMGPLCPDRHDWKHYFPATSLAGGNLTSYFHSCFPISTRNFEKFILLVELVKCFINSGA